MYSTGKEPFRGSRYGSDWREEMETRLARISQDVKTTRNDIAEVLYYLKNQPSPCLELFKKSAPIRRLNNPNMLNFRTSPSLQMKRLVMAVRTNPTCVFLCTLAQKKLSNVQCVGQQSLCLYSSIFYSGTDPLHRVVACPAAATAFIWIAIHRDMPNAECV